VTEWRKLRVEGGEGMGENNREGGKGMGEIKSGMW